MDIRQVQRILLCNFLIMIGVALLLVIFYECELLPITSMAEKPQLLFVLQVLMELVTIVVIPVGLKMFSVKPLRRRLIEGKGDTLLFWGTLRLNMLSVPMVFNVFFYYQSMSPAFGYLAIIIFLCLFFIYPSLERCETETSESQE